MSVTFLVAEPPCEAAQDFWLVPTLLAALPQKQYCTPTQIPSATQSKWVIAKSLYLPSSFIATQPSCMILRAVSRMRNFSFFLCHNNKKLLDIITNSALLGVEDSFLERGSVLWSWRTKFYLYMYIPAMLLNSLLASPLPVRILNIVTMHVWLLCYYTAKVK